MDPVAAIEPEQGWRAHVKEDLLKNMEAEAPDVVSLADRLQEQIGGDRMIVPLMYRGVELKLISRFEYEKMLAKLLRACHLEPVEPKAQGRVTGEST